MNFKDLEKGMIIEVGKEIVGKLAEKPFCENYQWQLNFSHAFTLTNDKDNLMKDLEFPTGGRTNCERINPGDWKYDHLTSLINRDERHQEMKDKLPLKEARYAGDPDDEEPQLKTAKPKLDPDVVPVEGEKESIDRAIAEETKKDSSTLSQEKLDELLDMDTVSMRAKATIEKSISAITRREPVFVKASLDLGRPSAIQLVSDFIKDLKKCPEMKGRHCIEVSVSTEELDFNLTSKIDEPGKTT